MYGAIVLGHGLNSLQLQNITGNGRGFILNSFDIVNAHGTIIQGAKATGILKIFHKSKSLEWAWFAELNGICKKYSYEVF